jgi:hypothetical protein
MTPVPPMQLVHRRARAFDIADDTGLHLQRIFKRTDAGFPAIFCACHKCLLRGGQVDILVLGCKLGLDLLHVIGHPLGLGQKLLGLADLRLQRRQHGQRQGRQILGLIDQRCRFVLERFDLIVDLLECPRGRQDVLRIVAGVVDDPAELGIGRVPEPARLPVIDSTAAPAASASRKRENFMAVTP